MRFQLLGKAGAPFQAGSGTPAAVGPAGLWRGWLLCALSGCGFCVGLCRAGGSHLLPQDKATEELGWDWVVALQTR